MIAYNDGRLLEIFFVRIAERIAHTGYDMLIHAMNPTYKLAEHSLSDCILSAENKKNASKNIAET